MLSQFGATILLVSKVSKLKRSQKCELTEILYNIIDLLEKAGAKLLERMQNPARSYSDLPQCTYNLYRRILPFLLFF